MKLNKLAATALISIAATGIAAGTGYGQPASVSPISTTDHGVTAVVTPAPDHSSITTTLTNGRFIVKPGAVDVLAANGSVVGEIPTTIQAPTRQYHVSPQLDRAGTTLTLRPVDRVQPTATDIAALKHIGLGGLVVGVSIGCLIGFVLTVWFFFVGGIIGCAIGAVIGGTIGLFWTPF